MPSPAAGGDIRRQSGGWQGEKGGEMSVDKPGERSGFQAPVWGGISLLSDSGGAGPWALRTPGSLLGPDAERAKAASSVLLSCASDYVHARPAPPPPPHPPTHTHTHHHTPPTPHPHMQASTCWSGRLCWCRRMAPWRHASRVGWVGCRGQAGQVAMQGGRHQAVPHSRDSTAWRAMPCACHSFRQLRWARCDSPPAVPPAAPPPPPAVALPARGRTVLGQWAASILLQNLPRYVHQGLLYPQLDRASLQARLPGSGGVRLLAVWSGLPCHRTCATRRANTPPSGVEPTAWHCCCNSTGHQLKHSPCRSPCLPQAHVECVEDTQALRDQLPGLGLVAFVGDGAVLPRCAGVLRQGF